MTTTLPPTTAQAIANLVTTNGNGDVEGDLIDALNEHGHSKQQVTLSIADIAKLIQIINGTTPVPPAPPSGLGNPGPLGLGAFALTTFILSVFNAGVFLDAQAEPVVLAVALWYGGVAQFIAGLYEYKVNNTFGATAFCSYGAFWVSFATYVQFVIPNLSPNHVSQATGIFLFAWMIFTLYMCVASVCVSVAVMLIFFVLEITFILLVIGAWTENNNVTRIGGWFGIATAFLAWYGSAAVVINTTWGKALLPVGAYKKERYFSIFRKKGKHA